MKKTIKYPLIILILLIAVAFIPTSTSQDVGILQNDSFRFFNFNTTTNVEIADIEALNNPILPDVSVETDINIKFKFEKHNLFPSFLIGTKIGNWIMFRDTKQNMTAEIELTVESPEWCTAELEKDKIEVKNFTTDFVDPVKTKINITIKSGTEALTTGTIKIKANFSSQEKWGLTPSGDVVEKTVTVDYHSDISTEIENNTIQITPLKSTYIPIKITNNGNGKTTVKTNIKDIPKNWTISFNETDTELGIGETKELHLNVTSIKDFDNETIKIELSSVLTQDNSYEGETKALEITLQNDGSLKDEEDAIDTTLLIIILIAILAIIIIVGIIIKMRKQ